MKKNLFTLFVLINTTFFASAYDFMADGLAYDINSDSASVTVTYTQQWSENNYSGLTTANIPESLTYNSKNYSVTSIGDGAFNGCSGLSSVTIPNTVTSIGEFAFYECSGLTSVAIPNSVTHINYGAFAFSGLTSVTIPNTVIAIGGEAFNSCSGLTSVNIPNSVTTIGYWAFYGTGLTSIIIPNSVTEIGREAFNECSDLTTVTLNSNALVSIDSNYIDSNFLNGVFGSQVRELIIGNDVTSIGNYAFFAYDGLTSVTIGNSVTWIGNWAFYGTGLTSIIIPNSVTEIGVFAFCQTGLKTVTIPNSITSIGESAFGCSSLNSIHSKIMNPQSINYLIDDDPESPEEGVFIGVPIETCKLYVPKGTLELYQTTSPWCDFLNIIEEENSTTPIKGDVNGDGVVTAADVTEIYNILLGTEQ